MRFLMALCLSVFLAACDAAGPMPQSPTPEPTLVEVSPTPAQSAPPGVVSYQSALDSLSLLRSFRFEKILDGQREQGIVVNEPQRTMKVWQYFDPERPDVASQVYVAIDDSLWVGPDEHSFGPAQQTAVAFRPRADSFLVSDPKLANLDFTHVGNESHNGIECTHLTTEFRTETGAISINWRASLWVATEGAYLVGADFTGYLDEQPESPTYGASFEISHINDASNAVVAPSAPTPSPTIMLVEPTPGQMPTEEEGMPASSG